MRNQDESVSFSRLNRFDERRTNARNYGTTEESIEEEFDGLETSEATPPNSPALLLKNKATARYNKERMKLKRKDDGPQIPLADKEGELSPVLVKQWTKYYHYRLSAVHGFMVLYTISFCINYLFETQNPSITIVTGAVILLVYSSIVFIISLILMMISRSHTFQTVVSFATAAMAPTFIYICLLIPSGSALKPYDGLSTIITYILIVYTCLKLPPIVDGIWCTVISAGHVFLLTLVSSQSTPVQIAEIAASIVALLAANVMGCFHGFYLRKSRKTTFDQFNDAVEKRTIVEYEKERQEQLLLSVIPVYLAAKVRKTILNRTSKTRESIDYSNEPPRMFQDLHVQQHENVSILFADIVNFTPLTAELTAAELVRLLNELYTRFDTLAQEFQCMRIKILGDCYYCVSGMPVSRPNHADNCIKMGLAMIDAIKVLRECTSVNIDMRIGIHSGSVLCGLLGLRKWQYDIWSDDVNLANRMESCGSPGKLHITKATLQLISGFYKVLPAYSDDEYLRSLGLETFFIEPTISRVMNTVSAYELKSSVCNGTPESSGQNVPESMVDRTKSFSTKYRNQLSPQGMHKTQSKMSKMVEFWGAESPFSNLSRRRSSDHIRIASINLISNSFETRNYQRFRMFCNSDGLTASEFNVLLRNRDDRVESSFWDLSPVSPNYALCVQVVAALFISSTGALVSRSVVILALYFLALSILIGVLLIILLAYLKGRIDRSSNSNFFAFEKFKLSNSLLAAMVLVVALLFTVSTLVSCQRFNQVCYRPQYILPMCQLMMMLVTVVFCLSFITKAVVLILSLVLFNVLLYQQHLSQIIHNVNSTFDALNYSHSSNIISNSDQSDLEFNLHSFFDFIGLTILLAIITWLVEFERKLNWACLMAFRGEQDDVETMQNINTILLQNILPDHVAAHFLDPDRNPADLYHENHPYVCVMFASIPNFKDFWGEWDFSRKLECLRLLNEIVCDFDKLLSKPKFSNVEKIKTVGSTYMAAAGLHPSQALQQDPRRFTAILVEFAFAIMNLLDQLNKDSFQNFQLRIGISYGPVIAGVVGAQKPQYDIFGNTVNLASRMDTHGVMGKIHVTPETATALIAMGYEVESRGLIKVKGVKDEMETFFIHPPQDRKSGILQ